MLFYSVDTADALQNLTIVIFSSGEVDSRFYLCLQKYLHQKFIITREIW